MRRVLLAGLAADLADMLLGGAVRRGLFHRSHPRPFHGDDEPKTLRYANRSICPTGADGEQAGPPVVEVFAIPVDPVGFLPELRKLQIVEK